MKPAFRRRNKLPYPRFQLRLIGGFVALSLLGLFLQVALLAGRMLQLAARLPSDGLLVQDDLTRQIVTALAISLGVILPVTLVVGVFMTFRWAGPLYRFHKHLREVAEGGVPGPCRLRDGDELQELCTLINEVTEPLRQGLRTPAAEETADADAAEVRAAG